MSDEARYTAKYHALKEKTGVVEEVGPLIRLRSSPVSLCLAG